MEKLTRKKTHVDVVIKHLKEKQLHCERGRRKIEICFTKEVFIFSCKILLLNKNIIFCFGLIFVLFSSWTYKMPLLLARIEKSLAYDGMGFTFAGWV